MSSRYTEEELEVLQELGTYHKMYENLLSYSHYTALYIAAHTTTSNSRCSHMKLEKCMHILINLCDNHDVLWGSDHTVIERLEDFEGGLCHTERTLRRVIECINTTKRWEWVLWPVVFHDMRSKRKNAVKMLLECVEFSSSDLRRSLFVHKRAIEHTFYVDMIINTF